ncbi:hypothetical protein CUC62_20080 [Acinetobacter baumannii]|nr:hypothetical protein CUC62_20080 [Acinetobacter baumannii]
MGVFKKPQKFSPGGKNFSPGGKIFGGPLFKEVPQTPLGKKLVVYQCQTSKFPGEKFGPFPKKGKNPGF